MSNIYKEEEEELEYDDDLTILPVRIPPTQENDTASPYFTRYK